MIKQFTFQPHKKRQLCSPSDFCRYVASPPLSALSRQKN